jgi:hypothetical protein
MKVIILGAGYATRLYPLTLTRPKPLLPVAGKPMIDYVLDNLAPIGGIDRVIIVTNAKFADQFQKWADDYRATKAKLNFTIVNDGSTDDTNKLGAIGDLNLVIDREKIDDDVIVVAGDNLFSEPLTNFGKTSRSTTPSPSTRRARLHSSRRSPSSRPAPSPASRSTFTRRRRSPSSSSTSPRATTRTSRAAWCNGFTREHPSMSGTCPACGTTSGRRRPWRKPTASSRRNRSCCVMRDA